jgi:hypothetical protein
MTDFVRKDGTLLAFCNGRVGTPKDNCPYQTIVLRRSKDNGKTFDFKSFKMSDSSF